MPRIKPFRALRPHKEYAAQLASRPYDVLSTEEARQEADGNLVSFLHITKPEIDLAPDVDPHSQAVYDKGKETLQRFIDDKVLFREEKPCYYIYELAWQGRTQTGLVCTSSVEDYFSDVIKKHEFTRPEKEKDRIDHMTALRAQTGNVFLACRDVMELTDLFEHWKEHHFAEYSFTAADGVTHSIWIVDALATIDSITAIFAEKLQETYIADGHHRCASAAKVSQKFPDSEDAQFFLTTIFPSSQLAIMDYNRVVKDLNNHSSEDFVAALQEKFSVAKVDRAFRPEAPHQFGMYLPGQWYRLDAKEGTWREDAIGVLDVTILTENILDPLLGIKDQRTDKRVDFVGGIRGLEELEKRVDSGDMAAAFNLYPVTMEQLFNIADAGEVMPPKSTWFEPKLRDGLLTHCF